MTDAAQSSEPHVQTRREPVDQPPSPTAEIESREVAEESREISWKGGSFLREVFLGRFRPELIETAAFDEPTRPEFTSFMEDLRRVLDKVDSVAIDESGEYPEDIVQELAEIGAFGMKIPKQYGGLGLHHAEYVRAMAYLGSVDGNLVGLLSAHQAIGVPQPTLLFGTEEQKRRFLPRCAKGAISAFALTEPAVGSDPARLATTAERTEDGFVLNGAKLWTTNGTLAELIVVMARHPDTGKISAFVVDMNGPGATVEHRCRFMGLRALANAYIRLENVRVPKENLIGEEGRGLRIALTTLNTGRLSLPAVTGGMAKKCTEIVRKWSTARVQWGVPIGKHEAIAKQNAFIASSAYALESVAQALGHLADDPDRDIRLEAAAAKEWNTVRAWHLVDTTLQVRGGRGFETERSLADRGEPAIGIERMMRDSRINLIFEGSSEVMHLFIAREALDKHLEVAGSLVHPKATAMDKLKALPNIVAFYAGWYPSLWFKWGRWPKFKKEYGALGKHMRFAERATRRLARALFHGMVVHRAGLERRQGFLFRAVDVALEIFVMTCAIRRAQHLDETDAANAKSARRLTVAVARAAETRIRRDLRALWRNDDAIERRIGKDLLEGRHGWLEEGIQNLPYTTEDLVPPTMEEIQGHEREDDETRQAA